jgi:hypothetical protein
METTTRAIIAQAKAKMHYIAKEAAWTNNFADLAIEHRNDLLDEYRRAEQTIEALAEARKDYR